MKSITFAVPGEIVPWARAGRRGGVSFTPSRQGRFAAAIGQYAQIAMREAGWSMTDTPVQLLIEATWPWPAKTPVKMRGGGPLPKATKPDLDNVVKLVKDALNLIVYSDDARVSDLIARKRYGAQPGLVITVEPLWP